MKPKITFLYYVANVKAFSPLHDHRFSYTPKGSVSTCSINRFLAPFHSSPAPTFCKKSFSSLFGKKIDDNEEDVDDRPGMEDAFRALDSLSSFDLGNVGVDSEEVSGEVTPLRTDVLDDILKKVGGDKAPDAEDELKIYSEIYNEVENDKNDVYGGVLEELTGESIGNSEKRVIDDADGIGAALRLDEVEELTAVELSVNTDELMERAVKEALQEVGNKTSSDFAVNSSAIMDDEELKTEINAIFDRANEELLTSIDEIKQEQDAFSKKSAESRSKAIELEKQRLAEAEKGAARLVEKVEKERAEMAKAVAELEAVQEELSGDPIMKLVNLKKAGIGKQGALVGAFLFSVRSAFDLAMLSGPNGDSHIIPATIQALIALACAAFYLFF